jgi:hypothetical protein
MDLLDRYPLRSRKRLEYEIWREAVLLWSAKARGYLPGARNRLARLSTALKAAKVYRDPDPSASAPDLSDPFAVHHLAGFFSAEGCFQLADRQARAVVKLRRDDGALLEAFRRRFGIGKVSNHRTPWSPVSVWTVCGARDVLVAIELFDTAPLLGRKARQFRAWRKGAEEVARAVLRKRPVDSRAVTSARLALRSASAYRAPTTPLRVEDARSAAQAAHVEVLHQWASGMVQPLACTAYEKARQLHPHWPKRDTIARAFGSWYDALDAAGLADRAARGRYAS